MNNKIKSVEIKNLWGRIDVNWTNVFEDVNIIVGINGIGKSTMLRAISKMVKDPNCDMSAFNFDYISIEIDDKEIRSDRFNEDHPMPLVEVLNRDEHSYDGILTSLKLYKELNNGERHSKRFRNFSSIINELFTGTKKTLDDSEDTIIQFKDSKQGVVNFDRLSVGEKQMLVFLYKVYLTDEQPYILFLDEPELSLYIGWQSHLIDIIRKINPNSQLFIATHSPNIFSRGWGSRVVHIEDYITEI